MKGLSSKMSGDILVSLVVKTTLKARGLLLIPVLTILIGVAEYGAYVQVVALATLVGNICSLRLDSGYVRYIHKTDRPSGLYTSLVLLGTVVSILGGILFSSAAEPLAYYTLRDRRFSVLFSLGGVYIPLKCLFQYGRGYFRANRRIKLFSLLEAIDVYFTIGAICIAVFLLETWIVGAFAAFIVARGVVVVLIFLWIGYSGGIGRPDTTVLIDSIRFSIGSMGYLVSQTMLDKADRVLLGFFLGASAVGIYSAAYSLSYVMLLYYRPLSISFFPEFSKLWEDDNRKTIREYSITGIRFIVILGFPSVTGFWLVGNTILGHLSTATVATEGLVPLVLLAVGMLAKGIGEVYAQLFFAADDSRTPALIQGETVILNILLNIALIPALGIVGAALATMVSFAGAASVMSVRFQEYLPIGLPWSEIGRVTVATTVMTTLMWILEWHWLATVVGAVPLYFVLLFAVGGIRTSEIRFVVDSIL